MWKALSQGKPWSGLFKNQKKSGDFYWERAYINPVKNALSNRSHRFELYHKRKDGVLIPLEVTTTLLQGVIIDINKAMPVGLLLNEILNNTFKHAFKDRLTGNIYIKLEESDGEIHIIIADDGVGFDPIEFEEESASLGNTLIKSFLEQLNATYTLNSEQGTSYDIRFSA